MAKVIGIDLGTTYSAVSIWDTGKKEPIIIPNLSGDYTTPSIVSVNQAGEVIVGKDARQNFAFDPDNTVSQVKREMGNDFPLQMKGETYNPQTISAFILRYLKMCAEHYLGEEVHDAVITVPAYFTEVQRSATRDAGQIAGLNVLRLINEPTAAAIAYGVAKGTGGEDDEKLYAVYDLGGGTFDVSIIEVTADDVTVVGTGGDSRLGGLDMDEAVTKWALREIKKQHGVDLSDNDYARRTIMTHAEDIKKTLVVNENATLSIPNIAMHEGRPLHVQLTVSRQRFEMLIAPLLKKSIQCLKDAMNSAEEKNQRTWDELDGVLLVGGPTRLGAIRKILEEALLAHVPDKAPVILSDLTPDEVVAMGAAIVASNLVPIGRPPEEVEAMKPEEVEEIREQQREAMADSEAPTQGIYDVTGHSLGIAVEGAKMHRIIEKETVIPCTQAQAGFTNQADYTTQLLVQVYQGEEEFVAANTLIGEIVVDGLDPLPAGQQQFEMRFQLDINGTLSVVCRDLRTQKAYEGNFSFDGITRMSADEIKTKREKVMAVMAGGGAKPAAAAAAAPGGGGPAASAPVEVPALDINQIPEDWRHYWLESQEKLPNLDESQKPALMQAMVAFAQAVQNGNADEIEDKAFLLQDLLLDIGM